MRREDIEHYEIFCGIDVGKSSNHITALGRTGELPLLSRAITQNEEAIRLALNAAASCATQKAGTASNTGAAGNTDSTGAADTAGNRDNAGAAHGAAQANATANPNDANNTNFAHMLVTVDQFGAFGRLVVATAKDMGIDVAHMPPRRFRQVAETYGEDKFDAKDAFILADASRSMPRTIEYVGNRAETLAELKALSSQRDDVVAERTRGYNRLHDLIHQVCPPLEELFSRAKLHNDLEIRLVARFGASLGFRTAGHARATQWACSLKWHRTDGARKVDEVFSALEKQTVTLPGASVIENHIRAVASRIIELTNEERRLSKEITKRAGLLPEVAILKSIPGIGEVYGAVIAVEIGDIERFQNASHLASYAGVAPRKEESGTSVHRSLSRKGGNRKLKNALMQSSQRAVIRDEKARNYYERKRAEGKRHLQAIRALSRQRVSMIYAMLTNGTMYETRDYKSE